MLNILVLCTGNSARSILGEALINARGQGRLAGYSAGSTPTGQPNPLALETLAANGLPATGYSSKSWDVFSAPDAPVLDAVITVCDSAAAEVCPVWPGAPVKAHWGLPDPAAIADPKAARQAFLDTFNALDARITALMAALDGDDHAALKRAFETLTTRQDFTA
ncbi:arsenate reductase ArsC [Maricaulis sp.]|jgi:arsenate reductase (thioredoxin)|uniref:arsenate reductase ArsC n=1 Tax=Maricaulis sp. TaxID=1486257 RepID=UPI002602D9FA|nr:arsenate reductase ArsC [Maricaulis sp.]MDF1768996.1 arsenate reductase ArsC [Maricaulis sp.]